MANDPRARNGRPVSVGEILAGMELFCKERVERFENIRRLWPSVVGPARARNSAPFDLRGNILLVAARTPHAAQQISQMKGNIQRALKARWGLDIEEVRVTVGPPPLRASAASGPPRRRPVLKLDEEEVRAFREACPPDLDEEVAWALARLRACGQQLCKG